MALLNALLGPLAAIIDKVIPNPSERDRAKLELLKLESSQEMQLLQTRLSAIVAEAQSPDPWTSRARPGFLYVMYVMILCALPLGVVGAISPQTSQAIAVAINAYLSGIPEPLYALFGTGYFGYSAMRQWGKVKGVDK